MIKKTLRIATRTSPLALRQAECIKQALYRIHPDLCIELLGLRTAGDRNRRSGKGLFTKELEIALLKQRADLAVHSMKDLPWKLPNGLIIAAVFQRVDPRDVLLSTQKQCFNDLPKSARIGTSSLRRQAQLLALRPDLQMYNIHGNVNTRIKKIISGQCDVLILAAAGLIRLEQTHLIREFLKIQHCLPAPGQGALGIECRANDMKTLAYVAALNHKASYQCVLAERTVSQHLNADCRLPIAAYAVIEQQQLFLRARIAKPDGSVLLNAQGYSSLDQAVPLGKQVAEDLLRQGGDEILTELL